MKYYKHEFQKPTNKTRPVYSMPLPNKEITKWAEEYIEGRGLSFEIAQVNKWYGSSYAGDTWGRVVIPAINTVNFPYWQARFIGEATSIKRYQSPSYDRADSLIVVGPGNPCELKIAITEGPFDALAVAELGYIGVALMGNNPPTCVWDHFAERYAELKYMPTEKERTVLLVSDVDSVYATTRWQASLAVRGFRSRIVIPEKKDIAAMSLEQRKELLREK